MQSGFDYQIAIIGGGPAGATLGRLLPKGLSAILIDKKRAKGGFEKPCGGLLAPDAQKALSKYEITLPKSILVDILGKDYRPGLRPRQALPALLHKPRQA